MKYHVFAKLHFGSINRLGRRHPAFGLKRVGLKFANQRKFWRYGVFRND